MLSLSLREWFSFLAPLSPSLYIEEGEVRGREKGRAEGRQQVLLNLLRAKFGALSPALEDRLRARSVEELDALALRLLHAQSLEELEL